MAADRPQRWVTERFNAGRARRDWSCDGCHAKGTGLRTRELAHEAALAHTCPAPSNREESP